MTTKRIERRSLGDDDEWVQAWIDALGRTPKQMLRSSIRVTTDALRSGDITPKQADAYLHFLLGNYAAALAVERLERYLGTSEHFKRHIRGRTYLSV